MRSRRSRHDRRAAVGRLADAIEHAAEQSGPDAKAGSARRGSAPRDALRGRARPSIPALRRPWSRRRPPRRVRGATRPSSSTTSTASLRPTSTLRAQEQQRPFDGGRRAVDGEFRLHGRLPCAQIGDIRVRARLQIGRTRRISSSPISSPIRCRRRSTGSSAMRSAATPRRERLLGQFDEAENEPQHRALPRAASNSGRSRENADWRRNPSLTRSAQNERQLLRRRQCVLADDARHPLELAPAASSSVEQALRAARPRRGLPLRAPPRGEALRRRRDRTAADGSPG